ncbi:(2E,6E)-farnesyl diphosphate synthase [Aureimonas sp. SA4125]|uniref:polyprenyl synthetase family protein n=1 Tax=Aureimonas sp. SA4125 TaxID=2826993 RepID=UPI001CC53C31|nr:polyprenyl synthetase family protein [Aureimonas sp. SA4125]BDA82861.1 (2E,6E)-farnesyl diphosphate synthase [Aureimonas sp. SA4125]
MTADLTTSAAEARRRIDVRLAELMPHALPDQPELAAALRDGVLTPGKRLRPLMTLFAAEDLGGAQAPAIDAGCAVEMIHAASLVLDDMPCMDDALLRRGQPAVHAGHGEDLALLVSVAAISHAYGLLAGIAPLSPQARIDCIVILSRAVGVGGLVAGQFADLRGGRNVRPTTEISTTNGLKTGSLFIAAAEIGAVVAGADAGTRNQLRTFADELGQAFQLLDDLLDDGTNPLLIGKDVGKDNGKSTMVSLVGRASVQRRIERHLGAADRGLTEIFGPRSRLHWLVETMLAQARPLSLMQDVTTHGLSEEVGAR